MYVNVWTWQEMFRHKILQLWKATGHGERNMQDLIHHPRNATTTTIAAGGIGRFHTSRQQLMYGWNGRGFCHAWRDDATALNFPKIE